MNFSVMLFLSLLSLKHFLTKLTVKQSMNKDLMNCKETNLNAMKIFRKYILIMTSLLLNHCLHIGHWTGCFGTCPRTAPVFISVFGTNLGGGGSTSGVVEVIEVGVEQIFCTSCGGGGSTSGVEVEVGVEQIFSGGRGTRGKIGGVLGVVEDFRTKIIRGGPDC